MSRRRRGNAGIRDWKGKRQAYFEVAGKSHAKSFPKGTPDAVLEKWREDARKLFAFLPDAHGTLGADIHAYLARVGAMATYRQTAATLTAWADALGRDRQRTSITAAEIDTVMQDWLTAGLSPATVARRRTVLRAFWYTLDGKSAPNPVRGTKPPQVPKPEARGLDYATITTIIDAMRESGAKRRVTVLAWTGLPPSMLKTITPADLDLKAGTVRVRPRRKGRGVEARTLPLLAQGVEAFRAFAAADAFGPYSVEACGKTFQRACRAVGVAGVTLYDLRHSFGTLLYRATKDLATVARFMLHSTPLSTARYAQAAMQDVDRDAATRAATLAEPGRNLSRKPVRPKKRRKQKHLRAVS